MTKPNQKRAPTAERTGQQGSASESDRIEQILRGARNGRNFPRPSEVIWSIKPEISYERETGKQFWRVSVSAVNPIGGALDLAFIPEIFRDGGFTAHYRSSDRNGIEEISVLVHESAMQCELACMLRTLEVIS